ncbi:MAG: hypothetical protein H6779_05400 [Candidatus Nomurabacteria bacterium]|nr:MAG: hypothetical protein H6779_05400 [Candidatus Nomurabacteria bacterium]
MNNKFLVGGIIVVVLIGLFVFVNNDKAEVMVDNNDQKTQETKEVVKTNVVNGHEEINHHLKEAQVTRESNSLTADFTSLGVMPLLGESGAVGYGVITDKGTDQVIVSTTHAGVLDSETQKDASDPVWHNHIVRLGEVALCGENPGVIDITFESPGDVTVKERGLVVAKVPASFSGTHSLTSQKISFAPGTDVKGVVQFNLEPKFNAENELQAVCVTHIEEIDFDVL